MIFLGNQLAEDIFGDTDPVGEILKVAHPSMVVEGSADDWEQWTGMLFPESGDYVVPQLLGEPYLNKPPLQNWLIVLLAGNAVHRIGAVVIRSTRPDRLRWKESHPK